MREERAVRVKINQGVIHNGKNERATFLIRVLYQENNSWQGEVVWAETQKHQHFRSMLELIKLMDSVLTEEPSRMFK